MLRELLTIVYVWRRWGFRHKWTSWCHRLWDSNLNCLFWALHHNISSAFSPIHPILSALMKRELSFDSGYESLPQRREAEKRKSESLSSNPDPTPTHSYTSSAEKQNQTHSPRQRPISFWHLAWGSRIEIHILPLFMQSNILIFLDLESNCSHFSSHHTTQSIFVNQIVKNKRPTAPFLKQEAEAGEGKKGVGKSLSVPLIV